MIQKLTLESFVTANFEAGKGKSGEKPLKTKPINPAERIQNIFWKQVRATNPHFLHPPA